LRIVESMLETSKKKGLDLAVTHLNAPVGLVVSRENLQEVLRAGKLSVVSDQKAVAVLSYLFVELDPQLIVRCANEATEERSRRMAIKKANELYEDTVRRRVPRSIEWERSVMHLL
jgi:ribosome-binding ATPase YchF (GTP1/OBG family)